MRHRGLLPLLAFAAPGLAVAAEPVPDRPYRAVAGGLASGFEVEAGGAWWGQSFGAPLRAKLGLGSVEPRVGVDLAGLGTGAPGVDAGLKVGLVQQQSVLLGAYATSAVPFGVGDVWWGEAGGAMTARLDSGAQIRLNAALALVGAGGRPAVSGVPLRALLGVPVGRRLQPFGEAEAILQGGAADWTVQGGLGWQPFESVVFDASAGWDLGTRLPLLQAGLTANVGGMK